MLSLRPGKITFRLLAFAAGAFLSFGFVAGSARAQSQSDSASVAEAARKAREQKKNANKPTRTITNDDLPAAPTQTTAAPVPAAEPESGDQANPEVEKAPAKSDEAAGDSARKKAETEAALKRAKADLAQAQGELDVLQRKSALDSDSFYSQTNFSSDTAGKARLDDDARQVNDKRSQVDDLKSKVAALQTELGKPAEPAPQQ